MPLSKIPQINQNPKDSSSKPLSPPNQHTESQIRGDASGAKDGNLPQIVHKETFPTKPADENSVTAKSRIRPVSLEGTSSSGASTSVAGSIKQNMQSQVSQIGVTNERGRRNVDPLLDRTSQIVPTMSITEGSFTNELSISNNEYSMRNESSVSGGRASMSKPGRSRARTIGIASFEEFSIAKEMSVSVTENSVFKIDGIDGATNLTDGSDRSAQPRTRKPREKRQALWNASNPSEGENGGVNQEQQNNGLGAEGFKNEESISFTNGRTSRSNSFKNSARESSVSGPEILEGSLSFSLKPLRSRPRAFSTEPNDSRPSVSVIGRFSENIRSADGSTLVDADGNNIENELVNLAKIHGRRQVSRTSSFTDPTQQDPISIDSMAAVRRSSTKHKNPEFDLDVSALVDESSFRTNRSSAIDGLLSVRARPGGSLSCSRENSNTDLLNIPGMQRLSTAASDDRDGRSSGFSSKVGSSADISKSVVSGSDAKAKLKAMMTNRKSLAPDTSELNSLMAQAAKSSEEDDTHEPNIVRRPRISTVKEVSEAPASPKILKTPVLSEASKSHWNNLMLNLKWAFQVACTGRACVQKLLDKTNHVPVPTDAATMQSFLSEMDFATKVQELLMTPSEKRTGDLIQNLDKILRTRIADYGKMTESDRYHLCRIMRFEKLKKDTILLWEEHILTCFHIILVGKIEVFKLNKQQKLPLAVMTGGSMIGHARAKVEGATRTACAVLSTDCLLLAIDKDKYLNSGGVSKDMIRMNVVDQRALILEKSCVVFQQAPSYFSKIALFFDYHVWDKGEIVQEQGKSIDYIYFIIKGICSVTRKVPFVEKRHWEKSFLAPLIVPIEQFVPISSKEFEEKIVYISLQTQESLGVGDWFSYLPLAQSDLKKYPIEKDAIFRYRMLNPCDFSITSEDSVMTARINLDDLLDIAAQPLLRVMLDNCKVHRYGLAELQDQYLQDRAWENLKKNAVSSVVSQLRSEQNENKKVLQREGVMRASSLH